MPPSLPPPPRPLADGWTPGAGLTDDAMGAPAGPAVGAPPPAPDYEAIVRAEARKQGVPEDLAVAVMRRESAGNPKAVSSAGAEGLMQLMPDTARAHGVKNPFDPADNARGGVSYLKKLIAQHKGNTRLALASYNAGPGAVARYKDTIPPFKETQAYVNAIEPETIDPLDFRPAPPQGPPPAASGGAGGAIAPSADEAPIDPSAFIPAPEGPPAPEVHDATGRARQFLDQAQRSGQPGAIPNPRTYEQDMPGWLARTGVAVADSVDPTTPTGRRNIAGGLGAALGTAAVVGSGGTAAPLVAGAAGVLGATGGGMAAEAGEQLVGNAPPSTAGVLTAGAEQGGTQLLGEGLLWPVRGLVNRVLARPVSQRAFDTLKATREALNQRLTTALDVAKDALGVTRENATVARQQVADTTRDALASVRDTIRATKAGETAASAPYHAQVGAPPPSPVAAGKQAAAVIAGPATRARQAAGKAVEEAAASGPPVDITALKAQAKDILDRELKPSAEAFPTAVATEGGEEGASAGLYSSGELEAMLSKARTPAQRDSLAAALAQQRLTEAQAEGAKERLKHPAMGVIQRILNADDEVPFAAAHGFQKELDDAVLGTWDKAEKKRVTSMTQGLRGGLRQALRDTGHTAFEDASARYAQVAKLFTKGLGPQLKKTALDDPEAIVGLIRPDDPTKLGMLRELLTTTAAEGGGAAEGTAAWDSVRAAWTHQHVLKGGIETLGERLDKLSPDFVKEMYGDQTGTQVLGNLQALRVGYEKAVEAAEAALAPAEAVARAQRRGVAVAQRRQVKYAKDRLTDVQRAIRDARQVTPEEAAFLTSSIAPGKTHSVEDIAADAFRAGALFPGIWGGISLMRLLRGPKGGDMLRFVAYSPKLTQVVVKAFNTPFSPIGPEAAANLARVLGTQLFPAAAKRVGVTEPMIQVGQPPPAPAQAAPVGAPPPR